VGKPERKSLLGKSTRRWEDVIRIILRRLTGVCVEWIRLAQDRVPEACSCKRGDEYSGSGAMELVILLAQVYNRQ